MLSGRYGLDYIPGSRSLIRLGRFSLRVGEYAATQACCPENWELLTASLVFQITRELLHHDT